MGIIDASSMPYRPGHRLDFVKTLPRGARPFHRFASGRRDKSLKFHVTEIDQLLGHTRVDPVRYTVMTLGLTLNCEPPPLRSACFVI